MNPLIIRIPKLIDKYQTRSINHLPKSQHISNRDVRWINSYTLTSRPVSHMYMLINNTFTATSNQIIRHVRRFTNVF